jgi:hypothetical protein
MTPCSTMRSPGIPTGGAVLHGDRGRLYDRRAKGVNSLLHCLRGVQFGRRRVPEFVVSAFRHACLFPKLISPSADRVFNAAHADVPPEQRAQKALGGV